MRIGSVTVEMARNCCPLLTTLIIGESPTSRL